MNATAPALPSPATYRLGSCPMVHAPSIVAFAATLSAQQARRILRDGWDLPPKAADRIRAGAFTVDGDVVVVTVA